MEVVRAMKQYHSHCTLPLSWQKDLRDSFTSLSAQSEYITLFIMIYWIFTSILYSSLKVLTVCHNSVMVDVIG